MRRRIPTTEELASLSRDDWEALCAAICSLLYDAHRVEDHLGRGNGLDMWRETDQGIEGWQFRRLNERLGHSQIAKLKVNVNNASPWAIAELGRPLRKFTIVLNIDLQPSHRGAHGEIELMRDLSEWARVTHAIELAWHGISWVHARLLANPNLRPDLFEDIQAAVADAEKSISGGIDQIKARLDALEARTAADARLQKALSVLIREAKVHYERGSELHSNKEYSKSIVSLTDALRLVEDVNPDPNLMGQILAILSGVEALVGHLGDAVTHGQRGVRVLSELDDAEYMLFAQGNLAFALYRLQRYEEADGLLRQILRQYEERADLAEIARTLTHLVQMSLERGSFDDALAWGSRLGSAASALLQITGVSMLTLSALGATANVYLEVGRHLPDGMTLIVKAHEMYFELEELAEEADSKYLIFSARAQRARAAWMLGRPAEAESLYADVSVKAESEYPKLAADCQFNRALLLLELNEAAKARELLRDVKGRYIKIGDNASANDVEEIMREIG